MGLLDALTGRRRGPQPRVLLAVSVGGAVVGLVREGEPPGELTADVQLQGLASVSFEDSGGRSHRHEVPADRGWLHLSVRVHQGLGCQADAVVTSEPTHAAGAALSDGDVGVRFQPFFLAGATDAPDLTGRGLFARGLHFSGLVTPSNILLSCACDACRRSFLAKSTHVGFAEQGYFYSASGRHTLLVAASLPGAPTPLGAPPEPEALAALEARLPPAPDGTAFAYANPFRCPHCAAPYVDFAAHPGEREREYYALYFPDSPPRHWSDDAHG